MDNEKTEIIIELVKKKDILYNLKNPEYKNVKKKMQAWLEIATELGMSVEVCKKRWKSLRDCFSRERNKKPKSGQEAQEPAEGWKFFEQLLFLKEHLKPRLSTGNYDEECQQSETLVDMDSSLDDILPSTSSPLTFHPAKKRKTGFNAVEKELIATMDSIKTFVASDCERDEDDHFCASLLQKLKKFPLKEKNALKVELLQILNTREEELFLVEALI